ncbi:MAG: N-acetyltransferase [Planctomycetota bacterium]
MASLECTPVTTSQDRRAFLRFEAEVYRDDPNWVPPLWDNRKAMVGFKHHPFYDDADGQAFLARRNGRVVGRVLAIVNHAHNRYHEEQRGFFGFFECENHADTARQLFHQADAWLKAAGMESVRGPVHPSLNYEVGLLVDGFDTPPTFLIPYHKAYYQDLITACGFEKTQDLYSYEASIDMLEDLDPKLLFVIQEATRRFDVKCRQLDKSNFDSDIRLFLDIYNQSLQRTWGYVPMSAAEIAHESKGLKHLLVPELTSIAEIEGKPVGAGFGLLDYNPLIREIGGRLLPFGWLKLILGRKKLKRVRLVSANVLPEYQKWGLGLVTLYRILPEAISYGIETGEFSWVLESNSLSRGTIERGGALRTKLHRLYDRKLTSGA